jgi:hypothetical protein
MAQFIFENVSPWARFVSWHIYYLRDLYRFVRLYSVFLLTVVLWKLLNCSGMNLKTKELLWSLL